jgi:hypothetical protein
MLVPCFELVMHLELLAEIWAKISFGFGGLGFPDIHVRYP